MSPPPPPKVSSHACFFRTCPIPSSRQSSSLSLARAEIARAAPSPHTPAADKDPQVQIEGMNRLTKTSSRRGSGVRGTRSPSVHGPVTSAPAAGASATRSLPAATAGVAVPVSHTPSVSASPFGGWWPASSPSDG